MRISDWSSDVCSSDLQLERPGRRRGKPGPGGGGKRRQQKGIALVRPAAPEDVDERQADIAGEGRDEPLLTGGGHCVAGDQAGSRDSAKAGPLSLGAVAIIIYILWSIRSEERRVGKDCVSTCRSRW